MSKEPYSETGAIIELGKLDYERFRQAEQRCLDAGGCPECKCVAEEQGRRHWDHCSEYAPPKRIPCSKCGLPTTWDPTYQDLCYRCCRAENE